MKLNRFRLSAAPLATSIVAAMMVAAISANAGAGVAQNTRQVSTSVADDFYTPPTPLPGSAHGEVIRHRKFENRAMQLIGADNELILYRSAAADGTPIAVTASIAIPQTPAPPGGFPVISYAHGTVGAADLCAPSKSNSVHGPQGPFAYRYNMVQKEMLDRFVEAGYAVVRTDYEGLGTPDRTHPYTDGRSAGQTTLDAARALRNFHGAEKISNKLVIIGHSQGGHAAVWAGSLASSWTPEFDVRAVAAQSPGNPSAGTFDFARSPAVGGATIFLPLMLNSFLAENPQWKPKDILSTTGLKLFPHLEQRCAEGLRKPDSYGGIPANTMFKLSSPGFAAWEKYAIKNSVTLKVPAPVRISHALNDNVLPYVLAQQVAQQLKDSGSESVQLDTIEHAFAPVGMGTHAGSIIVDTPDLLKWVDSKVK